MAKGSRQGRANKKAAKTKSKNGGTVTPIRKGTVLPKVTELELTKIQLANEKIFRRNEESAKLEARKEAIDAQRAEVDRQGIAATRELNALVQRVNKRLGLDVRLFEIQDDGTLIPKQGTAVPTEKKDEGGETSPPNGGQEKKS